MSFVSNKSALGKAFKSSGLNELLSSMNAPTLGAKDELKRIPIEYLQPGKYQPRKEFDREHLQELADSIRSQGIIQPLIVRPLGDRKYEIIAGERRWRAAQLAGLSEVPAISREISDDSAVAMALIENIQRENLNSIEEAEALQRLNHEFAMTHDEIAKMVGKSRSSISNLLRLLSLNSDVKTMLERGDLEMGHAKVVLTLQGEQQSQAAKTIVEKGLSVRDTENYVRKLQEPTPNKTQPPRPDPDIIRLQNTLSDTLAASVTIMHSKNGKGKIIINYNTLDEFDGIVNKIK